MGLFSSKTVISVSANTLHIIDASQDPLRDAILESIVTGTSIPDNIVRSLLNGMGTRMRRAVAYARDNYYLGLPQGDTLLVDPLDHTDLVPYIKTDTGYPHNLLVTSHAYTQFTAGVAIYDHLMTTRKYNPYTAAISVYPAGLAFTPIPDHDLDDFEKKVTIRDVLLDEVNLEADIIYELYVLRSYISYDGDERNLIYKWVLDKEFTESVAIPGVDQDTLWSGDCLLAVYQQYDEFGVLLPTQYSWVYHLVDNTYPALHPANNPQPDEFLPVVPIRHNNSDYTDPNLHNNPPDPTNLYSTSIDLLNYLKLDFHQFGSKLNENPDIATIDHAYIMWGVDLQSEFNSTLYYLNEFFNNTALLQNANELDFLNSLSDPLEYDEPNTVYRNNTRWHNADPPDPGDGDARFDEHGLSLELYWDYITVDTAPGTVKDGRVTSSEKEILPYDVTIVATYWDPENGESTVNETETRHKLVLRSQIDETNVRTVSVHNLTIYNWIYGDKAHITTLDEVLNDPDEKNFVIPVQYTLAQSLKLPLRNRLYADSTILVVNAVEKTKVKWYQSGFFKFVLIVVAVVIAVYTGQAWIANLTAAVQAGTVAIFLLKSIVFSLLAKYAFDYFIETFGAKLGIIGAIILAIGSVVLSKGFGAFGTISRFTMSTAQLMLQGSQGLISSANEFLIQEGDKIVKEYEDFEEELEGNYEEIDAINDLLAWKGDLDPLLYIKPPQFKSVDESPSQFYARSLGLAKNTMYVIHDEIPKFATSRLLIDERRPSLAV